MMPNVSNVPQACLDRTSENWRGAKSATLGRTSVFSKACQGGQGTTAIIYTEDK
ncbi:MAG: hypothetical protein Q8O12_06970 [Candidatus Omnitrophota bacterium]|nr:hypothetical protein [Candidatus Omnitrophota bacterium]